jgi:xylulose-5-phosphate/fructose-6-phosphate phosphoketolase
VDDVAAEEAFNFMINSTDVVNFTTFNKNDEPRYIDTNHAKFQYTNGGASIFQFSSEHDPDFVLTAAGDIPTHEALEAIKIIKEDLPKLRLRFVGINALSYGAIGTTENKLSQDKFDDLYTRDKHIIAAFHGYPNALKEILSNYADTKRLHVHGFIEEGSTTTPHEMLRKNQSSRYNLAMDVAKICGREDLVYKYEKILEDNHANAVNFGEDLVK